MRFRPKRISYVERALIEEARDREERVFEKIPHCEKSNKNTAAAACISPIFFLQEHNGDDKLEEKVMLQVSTPQNELEIRINCKLFLIFNLFL